MERSTSHLLQDILAAARQLEPEGGDALQAASLEALGLYRCWRPQELRDLVMPEASVLLVLRGRKKLETASRSWQASPGEMLLVPAGTRFWLGNYPDESGQTYRGLAVRFSTEVIERFRQIYGSRWNPWSLRSRWQATAPPDFLYALHQWMRWCTQQAPDLTLAQHRQLELLLVLAQADLAGQLLLADHPSWERRVTALLHLDPARAWRMEDVAAHLGVSESVLRRHLQDEATGFRTLLEEVRLMQGLTLVQETAWAIGRVADAVGYRSQSRFSERFKRRFGLTPQSLRQTQRPDGMHIPLAGGLAESGERAAD